MAWLLEKYQLVSWDKLDHFEVEEELQGFLSGVTIASEVVQEDFQEETDRHSQADIRSKDVKRIVPTV